MLWLVLACTPEPEPDDAVCPEVCDVAIEVVPPDGLTGTLTVRTEPPGYAFGGDLLDAEGNTIRPIQGRSEVQIELGPGDLVAGETYTVSLRHACEAGEAKPACAEFETTFQVRLPPDTSSTPSTDGSVTDTFVQAPPPEVDVLFVIDNS